MCQKFSLLLALCATFLFSCKDKNQVQLIETNCKDEVATLGNLTFVFDKDLMPDSLLNEWDNTEYIKFEPVINGSFNWTNNSSLVFSPQQDLNPASTYTATFTKELIRHTKKYGIDDLKPITFYTPQLQLATVNARWAVRDENTKEAGAIVDLYFNYRVAPSKLKDLLQIEVDEAKQNFNILNTAPESKISINLTSLKMEDKDYLLKLKINKGLLPEGGSNSTDEDIVSSFILPSAFVVYINSVEANHDGSEGRISVFSSQLPVMDNIEKFIEIEPKVSFKTESNNEGFVIKSENFNVAQLYNITLKKGLRGRAGGTLKEEFTQQISFGQLSPSISFLNNKAIYLSDKGNKNVQVKIVNVPKVKITISKIYENNLLAANRYGYYLDDYYEEDYYYESYSDMQLGDVVYESEIETKNLPKKGGATLFNFDFSDKLPEYKGIYHIKIRSTEKYWLDATKFISLSDIGLIARESRDKVYVFASSIKNAELLSNVSLSLYGNNNQLVATATTNKQGYAEIDLKQKEFSGFKPSMITARNGDDFNYMMLNNTRVGTSRFDVGGKVSNATDLDAFVYAERDIYRPGEKVNVSVILRDRNWKVPGEIPLKIKLILPNGKELRSIRKSVNEQGSLETAFDLAATAITGNYYVEVYSANDILIANKRFLVEEFMPDRIKVTPALNKPHYVPGDTAILNVNATNYFGPPAAGRNYESEFQLKVKNFGTKKHYNYNFNIAKRNTWFDKVYRNGTTDVEGNISERFVIDKQLDNMGILQADFFVTVFDESGRPVNRKSTADIYTQNIFYGIGKDDYYYYPTNQSLSFPIIALNKNEKPQNEVKAKMQVIKHEYRTVLTRDGQYYRYDSQQEEKLIADQTITINGENTKYSFVARTPGRYELRLYKPGAAYYVSEEFYCYGWADVSNANFEVSNEGNIDIVADKEKYNAGETAKLLFKAPFNGKILVTVETNKVHSHFWLTTDNRAATATLNLKAEHLPNVYITATLIKPHEESDLPLTVAHGYKSLSVEEKSRIIPVQIFAEKQVRSNTTQKVKVKAAANSKVTLAVVDEGILAITGYKTPDPYNFFYQKRALEIDAYDIYQLLLPEVKGNVNLLSTGGDGEMVKRLNPLPNKRVKLVSYWSGITDASGNAEADFKFDIPQFSGQLRLMAVAYKDASFGSAESYMTVADPLVVSTSLPRFLSPKDAVEVPVTISNTTSKAADVSVNIKTLGPLGVEGNKTQKVKVNANAEAVVMFKVVAAEKIDAGKVIVEVNGLGEKFLEENDITVRPSSPLQKRYGSGTIAGNKTQTVTIETNNFIPSSGTYSLVVSKSPITEFANHLNELVLYPHGCTEQTVSAAFPQLYFGELASLFKKSDAVVANSNQNVLEAIRKIKMRQLYNGGLTLWESGGTEHWWATVYATHFLLEAQKAGFEVEKSLLEKLLSYLEFRLKKKELVTYYYNRNENKQIAPKEVAYSLFVMALAGEPQVNTMNYYKSNTASLSLDSKYLLAAAYALAGDKNKYKELLPSNFSGEAAVTESGGSFSSSLRDEAISLYVMLEVDANNNQVPVMAKHVANQLKQNKYYFSTQERAFSFLALGKMAKKANQNNVSAIVKVNGKVVGESTDKPLKLNNKSLAGNKAEITVSGSGNIYYYWQAEGITADGSYKEEDSYIKVRKTFYDRTGRVVDAKNFRQNELIVIGITLENSYTTKVENIVITDMLPAGFEIENPRTQEIPGMSWIKNAATPTAMDVRDDRINLFVDLTTKQQTYYYAVRAVSPGVFQMGPVSADAMYAGEYHSYHGAGVIKIEK
jgi:uncharacterized protein YfaS (alpha-2-macroglobulin family)